MGRQWEKRAVTESMRPFRPSAGQVKPCPNSDPSRQQPRQGARGQLRRRLRTPYSWSGECGLPRYRWHPPHRNRSSRWKTSGHDGGGRLARHARPGRAEGESGRRELQSGDLAPRLRFAIGHFHMFQTIGIGLMRRLAAKVEIVLARLAERPLTCPIRRRSMIEQTRDTKSVSLFFAHSSTPDHTKRRFAHAMVRRSALRDFRDILSGDNGNIASIARKSSPGQNYLLPTQFAGLPRT